MSHAKVNILDELAQAVIDMDESRVKKAAMAAIEMKLDAYEAIMGGLTKGMDRVNELFEQEEYFVPEILLCADAMYAGIEILKPYLPKEAAMNKKKGVIGVVQGDTHDIGKNLVRIMLENAGFEMIDLGRDVSCTQFVDTAGELKADLVCLSTLMTTTMDGMQVIIEDLKRAGIPAKTMVGGGPISSGFAKNIGADGYAGNAAEAARIAKGLCPSSSLETKAFDFFTKEHIQMRRSTGGIR